MRTTKSLLFVLASLAAFGCAAAKPKSAPAPPGDVRQSPAVAVVANPQPSAAAPAQANAPDDLIRDFYRQHDADRSPFFQTKDRARVDRYFAKATADLIWKDTTAGTGAITADTLYDSHDPAPKNFAVGPPQVENEAATVVVSFVNYGEKQRITYKLVIEDSAWKVADIEYKDGRSLLKLFKEDFYRVDEQEQESSTKAAPAGEFEGRYQVGDTTCTAKPAKMAYEVRWAKGAGVMIFFGEEGNRFVSEETGKGRDAFVFNDERLDTGTFTRADGKQLAVKRIK